MILRRTTSNTTETESSFSRGNEISGVSFYCFLVFWLWLSLFWTHTVESVNHWYTINFTICWVFWNSQVMLFCLCRRRGCGLGLICWKTWFWWVSSVADWIVGSWHHRSRRRWDWWCFFHIFWVVWGLILNLSPGDAFMLGTFLVLCRKRWVNFIDEIQPFWPIKSSQLDLISS